MERLDPRPVHFCYLDHRIIPPHGRERPTRRGQPAPPANHGSPASTSGLTWKKSLRGIEATNGVVEQASDQEIMDAKAWVDATGVGAEPASCATVAGLKKLVERGVIRETDSVCGILTGHLLKDPDAVVRYHRGELEDIAPNHANVPVSVDADTAARVRLGQVLERFDGIGPWAVFGPEDELLAVYEVFRDRGVKPAVVLATGDR